MSQEECKLMPTHGKSSKDQSVMHERTIVDVESLTQFGEVAKGKWRWKYSLSTRRRVRFVRSPLQFAELQSLALRRV